MSKYNHLLEINLAMLLISTSGVLGRYILLPPPVTIGLRALLAIVFLGIFIKWKQYPIALAKGDMLSVLLSGFLMGAHWVTYFYSLQLSSVAIGMLSLFTYPVITSLLEPLWLKSAFEKRHLLLGLLVLVGVYLLSPAINMENDSFLAILIGLVSAVCYAVRNLLVKTKITRYNGSVVMWYQVVVISAMMIPAYFFLDSSGFKSQLPYIAILALVTTAIGHTLFLRSFKFFSVTTASLLSSMQPIFGILLGIFFLEEVPSLNTIGGGALILLSVVIESKQSMIKRNAKN